jgi:hypothetical protein
MSALLHLAVLRKLRTELKAQGVTFPKKVWHRLQTSRSNLQKAKVKVLDIKVPVTLWIQTHRKKLVAGIIPRHPGIAVKTRLGLDYPELLVRNPQVSLAR